MNIVDRIKNLNPFKSQPGHDEIMRKTQEVVLGTDKQSVQAHASKNRLTKEFLKISTQARRVEKESQKLIKIVDTAYLIHKSNENLRVKTS